MTKEIKTFSDDEVQALWILASQGLDAMRFRKSFRESWLTEPEAERLVKKLDRMDNHIREAMAAAEMEETEKGLAMKW